MLTRTYETKPFVVYQLNRTDRATVSVQSMSMAKVYDDAIQYDFFYNCSSNLTYFDETRTPKATKVIKKFVKRFNEDRYDLVQIFNESFNMDEKFGKYYNEETLLFDDTDFQEVQGKDAQANNKTDNGITNKMLTGAGSFLLVALLKYISSLECVKNLVNNDDEKLKRFQQNAHTAIMKEGHKIIPAEADVSDTD